MSFPALWDGAADVASAGEMMSWMRAEDLNAALRTPDTTHAVSFEGYNITREWPGYTDAAESSAMADAGLFPQWELALASAFDVSAANATAGDTDGYIDVVSIRLSPPDALLATQSNGSTYYEGGGGGAAAGNISTWTYDVAIMMDLPDEWYESGADDDGTCASVLPAGCLEAIEQGQYTSDEGVFGLDPMPDCSNVTATQFLSKEPFTNKSTNFAFFGASSPPHPQGELLTYLNETDVGEPGGLRGRVYPMFLRWHRSDSMELEPCDPSCDTTENRLYNGVSTVCLKVESGETMAEVEDATAGAAGGRGEVRRAVGVAVVAAGLGLAVVAAGSWI